eukprot:3073512-Amphidinium_carterae.1
MHATHKLYIMVKMAMMNTWTDGKQERRRRRTSYTPAKLNYVLLHAAKAGSEPHSIMRRVMRQSN